MGALQNDIIYPHYTYDDYKHWEGDWELVRGVPYAMAPSPLKTHQNLASAIVANLYNQTENCLECEVLVEFDYKISNDTILRPDVVVTCNETNENYLMKAPEIVVEIISKSTALNDEIYKYNLYEKEKVKYYVLVYPNDLIAKIYKLENKEFSKEGDFREEEYFFEETKCKIKLDFKKIFKRFLRKL